MKDDRKMEIVLPDEIGQKDQKAKKGRIIEMFVQENFSLPGKEKTKGKAQDKEGNRIFTQHAEPCANTKPVQPFVLIVLLIPDQTKGHTRPEKDLQEIRLKKIMHAQIGAGHEREPSQKKRKTLTSKGDDQLSDEKKG
jgi:hypothetical protein